jgi:hypothetical protein
MLVSLRYCLVATFALGLVLLIDGCASPLWRYDHYVVEGALRDSTCSATIDGRPFIGNVGGLGEKIIFTPLTEQPPGQTLTMFVCRGIVVEFITAAGSSPRPGRYPIENGEIGIDTGTVVLHIGYSGVGTGPWPFALSGVHLAGKEGYLQLDAMTNSSVRGTFHAIVRRQPNGE